MSLLKKILGKKDTGCCSVDIDKEINKAKEQKEPKKKSCCTLDLDKEIAAAKLK